MNISKSYNEKELTLAIEGRIDTLSSKELETEINGEIGNFDSLIIDFADLDYISSAGLRVLIVTQKKLMKTNTSVTIKNVNDEVRKVFQITGFDKILTIE